MLEVVVDKGSVLGEAGLDLKWVRCVYENWESHILFFIGKV